MNILKHYKTSTYVGVLCASVALSAFCTGCNSSTVSDRSDYYTRGIGQYPGSPNEDFSPELRPDRATYRNIAKLRTAFNSSSYDYNLTAQLATDGIITDQAPQFIVVSTDAGDYPRREREWMIDQGPYSRNMVTGDDTYIQFTLANFKKEVERVQLTGSVMYDKAASTKGYELTVLGSDNGTDWNVLGKLAGKNLPGAEARPVLVTDPNKQTEKIMRPVRNLNESIVLDKRADYSMYRVAMSMPGAEQWNIHAMDFYDNNQIVEMKPSQFFTSAWMSATGKNEWISVDLGSVSEFDKLNLHWINKAIKGTVQVSNDGEKWTDIASLTGDDALLEEISLGKMQQGRYVRLLLDESADGKPFILSEMEVMGKGGLVPAPAQMPQNKANEILLSGGNWQLQRASEVKANGEQISKPGFNTADWIVATVPGTVLSSYKNIGAVPNPDFADYQNMISESFFYANFWYRDEFVVPENFIKERVFLNFDGINWKANVFVNGQAVGDIAGAFKRGNFDVTDYIQPGTNVIAIEIARNNHIGAIKEKNEQSTDFNGGILGADNPTFHATIGWDWIQTVRGRNIGIWNDVKLNTTGAVTVADPLIQSVLPLPDTTSVQLTARVFVKNNETKAVNGVLKGNIGDITFEQPVSLAAGQEDEIVFDAASFPQLNLENPRLWWPKGYGEPNLYDANFTFILNDKVSDSKDFKAGIRQMTFTEDNDILNMYVNGRRFIGRGGNWGFSESNLNYRGREYDAAIAYHADMNFNIMRNWVGMTGDEELYEAADRHGIMVWQDFWLANPADGPDPYYPEMFIDNAEDYLRRIRNHASIGIYCGRNEGFPPMRIDTALRRIVNEGHGDIHYISSSADGVVSGHGPYRMLPAQEYFSLKTGNDKFHTERGMPNVMTYESMLRTFSPEGIWPQGDEWGMHDYTREGAQGCTTFNEIIALGYGKPTSAKEFADLAQWVNYDGHRSLFESRSRNRQGLLMWMSHPAWPSMVWQTYDYYFEPTAGYFAIKKASEPLHIQWNPVTDEVEVVNYSAGKRNNLKAVVRVLNMDASTAWEKEAMIDSNEDTTLKPFTIEYPESVSKVHFITMDLYEGDKLVSENFYHRSLEENNYQDLGTLPKVALKKSVKTSRNSDGTWSGVVTIENPSETVALMTRLNVVGKKDGIQILPMFYSDNYFALLPGEQKEITLRWNDVDTRGNEPQILLTGYNVK